MRRSRRRASLLGMSEDSSLTRRQVLARAGGTGLLVAAGPVSVLGSARPASAASASADGWLLLPKSRHTSGWTVGLRSA